MKVIVAGSRWVPVGVALLVVDAAMRVLDLHPGQVIIGEPERRRHGQDPVVHGPHTAGKAWAETQGVVVRVVAAHYGMFGAEASADRNARMVAAADVLIALWDGRSTTTGDLIARAAAAGLRVPKLEIVPSDATWARMEQERLATARTRRKPRVKLPADAPVRRLDFDPVGAGVEV